MVWYGMREVIKETKKEKDGIVPYIYGRYAMVLYFLEYNILLIYGITALALYYGIEYIM